MTGPPGPGPAGALPADASARTAALAEVYAYPTDPPRGHWLRANFVSTVDGAATAADGVTRKISGAADREVLALLRALADVIVVGWRTAQAEGYGPATIRDAHAGLRTAAGRPAVPPIAVATTALDVDLDAPLFSEATQRTIILTSAAAPVERIRAAGKVADVIVAGDRAVDLRAAVAALAARGHRRLLCEGGPRLLVSAAEAGVLDELCLTLSPFLAAGPAPRIADGPLLGEAGLPLHLAHTLPDGDFLFLRYLAARHTSLRPTEGL